MEKMKETLEILIFFISFIGFISFGAWCAENHINLGIVLYLFLNLVLWKKDICNFFIELEKAL